MAVNYMDGDWHDWHGGECPVPGHVEVEVKLNTGSTDNTWTAGKWYWDDMGEHTITRFRVLNQQPTQTGPVRTVTHTTTHKEIVDGVYGRMRVSESITDSKDICIEIVGGCAFSASELTDFIASATAIRDALAEQG